MVHSYKLKQNKKGSVQNATAHGRSRHTYVYVRERSSRPRGFAYKLGNRWHLSTSCIKRWFEADLISCRIVKSERSGFFCRLLLIRRVNSEGYVNIVKNPAFRIDALSFISLLRRKEFEGEWHQPMALRYSVEGISQPPEQRLARPMRLEGRVCWADARGCLQSRIKSDHQGCRCCEKVVELAELNRISPSLDSPINYTHTTKKDYCKNLLHIYRHLPQRFNPSPSHAA